jgi:hypothetical protein
LPAATLGRGVPARREQVDASDLRLLLVLARKPAAAFDSHFADVRWNDRHERIQAVSSALVTGAGRVDSDR